MEASRSGGCCVYCDTSVDLVGGSNEGQTRKSQVKMKRKDRRDEETDVFITKSLGLNMSSPCKINEF